VKIKLGGAADDRLPPLRVRVFPAGGRGAEFTEQPVHDGLEIVCA
jgi:hypothetical protein